MLAGRANVTCLLCGVFTSHFDSDAVEVGAALLEMSQTTFIEAFLFISCHFHPVVVIVQIIVQFVIVNYCALSCPDGELFVVFS